ncbi:TipJ family phage tail tip protein [Salipiger abyssi]|uniref:Phage tail fiber protein n=1 Tax=Salipiger abyssi TaxID=1250539 RepID=A0A1P8UUW7_9RHOB|nr:hypothetical protein [Salipiger abyssi]APZ53146.1 Phage tail fiber protein [Salipiger abyssi]
MTAVLKYDPISSQPEHVGDFDGLSVAQLVDAVLPGAAPEQLDRTRVLLAHRDTLVMVPQDAWARVYPHAGTRVLIRTASGDPVSVGAWLSSAIGQSFYLATGASLGGAALNAILVAGALATTGLLVAAMGALMPKPQQPGEQKRKNSYAATGWQNDAPSEDQCVPVPMGEIRVAPFYAMFPTNYVVGDDLYISAMFCLGVGPLNISDMRFGDASVDDYQDVQIETRSGLPDDVPFTLIRKQYVPEDDASGSELQQPEAPLDQQGEPIEGEPEEEQPQVYGIASRATGVRVIFAWRSGLYYQKSDGDTGYTTVTLRIDQRRRGTETWSEVVTLEYRNNQLKGFFRQYEWDLPDRERWEVRITNLTTKDGGTQRQNTTHIHALYSIRPEYPIATDTPLALVAINAKSQSQLDGTIDSFNALVSRPVQSWDGSAWSEAVSDNPADLYRYALQSGIHPYPVADEAANLEEIEEFAEFCTTQGLTFNGDIREQVSLGQLLSTICAAGRGAPHHDGAQWGVIIDRPANVVDHISPVSSWGFEADLEWPEFPHAVWFEFQDAAFDHEPETVYVLWPGHTGSVTLTEQWEVPGKTNRTEAMREVYRRMLEAIYRRERFYALQEGPVRPARRGDTVLLSQPILRETQGSGRIVAVRDKLVVLNNAVTMVEGQSYVLRTVEHGEDEDGPFSASLAYPVMTVPGETRTLYVTGDDVPSVAPLVDGEPDLRPMFVFGPVGEEGFHCRVVDIEPAEDMAVRLSLTLAAEEIDALVEAWEPEEWSPISGVILPDFPVTLPPLFWGIATDAPDVPFGTVECLVRVSAREDPAETGTLRAITVEHRLAGETTWQAATIHGPSGAVTLTYNLSDQIELRLVGVSAGGSLGPYSDAIAFTVGDEFAPPSDAPDVGSITAVSGLGHVAFQIAIDEGSTLVIFRTPDGDAFDVVADEIDRIAVRAGQTLSYTDGDSTRMSIIADIGGSWSAGGGWVISGNSASHTPGSASNLEISADLEASETYRGAVTVSGRTAGNITVKLTGGQSASTGAISENGQTLVALVAGFGDDRVEIVASADFDGSVSGVSLYRETAACAPQGAQDYRFAVLNDDDLGSDVSGQITTTII